MLTSISPELPEWQKQVHLHKAVYCALNNFKCLLLAHQIYSGKISVDTNGFLAAECWIPERNLETVREAIAEGVVRFKESKHLN